MRNFMTNLKSKIDWVFVALMVATFACFGTVWYSLHQAFSTYSVTIN